MADRAVWSLGNANCVGFTNQADGTTGGWGGTAKTLRWFKAREGSAKINIGRDQEHDPKTMSTDPEHITSGGSKCSGTFALPLSYAYEEGIVGNICGAPTVKSGESAPYSHTGTPAMGPVYSQVAYYWHNYKGGKYQLLANNVLITKATLVFEDKKVPYVEINWTGQKWTSSTPGAAPTVVTMEFIDWDHVTFETDARTLIFKKVTVDIDWPAEEDDYGTGGADDPAPVFIARGDQRVLSIAAEVHFDDDVLALVTTGAGDYIEDNSIVANNSGTTTAEREFSLTFGDLKLKPVELDMSKFGRLPVTLNFISEGDAQFTFVTKNAISADEPPAA